MRDIEIWEAVALTLNLEPDQLPVYLGAFDKLGDDPFRICPTPFLERLLVANSNCGISFGFKPVHELKARCLVDLPEFAAWSVKLNIPNLPPELVALAAPTEQLAIAQNTATPVLVVAGNGKKWTLEKLAELKAYRERHTESETAKQFGISGARIRQLLPSQKPKANPFTGLIRHSE